MASEFETDLAKLIGVKSIDLGEIMDRLSADELGELVDARAKKNAARAKELLGDITKSETDSEDDSDVEDNDELSVLLKSKEEAKQSSKKKKKILKKSTQGRHAAENTSTHRIGDNVAVEGEEATVKSPKAPGGTVGVMIDGELKMVDKKDVHKLGEGVLGMTGVPALQRIKELAGIGDEPVEGDVTNIGVPPAMDDGADDTWPNTPALPAPEDVPPVGDVDPTVGPEMDAPLGDEPLVGGDDLGDDDFGMDGGLGDDTLGLAPEAPLTAAPSEVPGLPGLPGLPSEDDAAKLEQAFADIEALIPNVKISEFKSVVARLNGLVTLAQNAGKAALTESRMRDAMIGGAAAAGLALAGGGMAKGAYDYHRGGGNAVGATKADTDLNNNWRGAVKGAKRVEEDHFDDQDRRSRSKDDDWLFGNPDDDEDDVAEYLPKHSRKGFAEDDHFDAQDRKQRRKDDDWLFGNADEDDDDISDFLPGRGRGRRSEYDEAVDFDTQDRNQRKKDDDWMFGNPDEDEDDLNDYLPARKRRPFAEDSFSAKDTVSRARDIVAKGGKVDKKDDKASEVGRKTLFDYMKEAEQDEDETIGVNRAEAAKTIQNRMGPNANPKDANDALDAMMKSGSVQQQGGRFMMDPTSDEGVQGAVAQAKAAQAPKPQQPAAGASKFQGSSNNGKYQ